MINRHAHGRAWPSLRWLSAGLVVAAGAALGGWTVAHKIAADTPAAPVIQRVLQAGPARLKVSTGWSVAPKPPALPGLTGAPAWNPYSGLATTVSVALVPVDDPALVPNALVKAATDGLPSPERTRVVQLEARAYRGVHTGNSTLDVYAIPTTRGVLTLVCTAQDAAPGSPSWCLNGLDQITVAGATPLKPTADTAFRMRSPETLRTLDTSRVRERRALRQALGPAGQERSARALWRSYRTAAAELAPFAPPGGPPAEVVAALRDTARAYRSLAVAANRRSPRAWSRARIAVNRAEQAFKRRVAATG
jgi:hypothetical protein